MDSSLPNILKQSPHLAAIYEVAQSELQGIDISACMMALVDTVNEAALPYLAKQFDVLGYSGYRLATTVQQKRDIIKQAIVLKKKIGTVAAIKQAMVAVGYGGATLVESSGTIGDGHDWARFKVVVDLGLSGTLDTTTAAELTELINKYKNARSKLDGIEYDMQLPDDVIPLPSEAIDVEQHMDVEETLFTGGLKLDGSWLLDGSNKLHPGIEDLQITIL